MTDSENPPDDEQVDLLDELTIAEIDAGSRALGTSLVTQLTTHGERYEKALAVVLWLHRRRTDRSTEPGELLRQLTGLRFTQLQEQLEQLADQLKTAGAADPLAPGNA